MAERYRVPIKHARKVARLANSLFTSLHSLHELSPMYGRLLEAAAYLHDIGHYVSDNKHHKHSYYLVLNSDMPGFTAHERELIANLCRYHRKAAPNDMHLNFQGLDPEGKQAVEFLAPILRLADSLDRSQEQRVNESNASSAPTTCCSNCAATAISTSKPGPPTALRKCSSRSTGVRSSSPASSPKRGPDDPSLRHLAMGILCARIGQEFSPPPKLPVDRKAVISRSAVRSFRFSRKWSPLARSSSNRPTGLKPGASVSHNRT